MLKPFRVNCFIIYNHMIIIYIIVSYPGGGMFKLPMSHRIEIDPEDISVTFDDVKGVSNTHLFHVFY